ncbi:MAG: hypothetical protein A3E91_00605 [Candidatus Moranbacteria bacterium RIFCSPHIGHO2_12_FULL_40_10]|nr:MAG: hypothetical protein A3E91_00605 [Candidatus Moranbacteria bacterium RIFCSPHIGHO2_12_FULL_40_10]
MTTKKEHKKEHAMDEENQTRKIQSLREMINSAEKTIQSAKAMLLQFEGKKKTGRRRKVDSENDGTIIEGTFDGQIMIGSDGKQYPVPANYASKSKLVEGDMLKLTITPDGSFIYKQIGPVERRHALGIASQDETGNYYIIAEGKPYKILLASVTYFKAEPGDEVAIVVPRDIDSHWAAIENIIQKAKDKSQSFFSEHNEAEKTKPSRSVVEEWTEDIKDIEKELKEEQRAKQDN